MTQQQLQHIHLGSKERKKLSFIGQQVSHTSYVGKYPHHYIYSPPGLGKTHTVNNAMKMSGVKYYMITGNVSMFAFGLQLAVIYNLSNPNEYSIISVDDCNELFRNPTNINIMKNVLGENRVFHYQKNLGGLYNQLDDIQKQSVDKCLIQGKSGFLVPTDKMIFVFTANEKLPTDEMNLNSRDKHLLAIRDRVTCHDFDLEPLTQCGWIADVIINTDSCSFVSSEIRKECVDFLFENWSTLTTKSIRTAIKMCEDSVKFPTNYKDFWRNQYVK